MTIGERIKKLRTEKLHMSQIDFADAVGISKQLLYKYEHNIITNIPSDKIEIIADLCRVSPSYIVGWEESDVSDKDATKYYLNPETAEIAQQIYDDPELRVLFDAARGSKPNDLQMAADMLKRFKETNPDG